jgi:hypothetical protein
MLLQVLHDDIRYLLCSRPPSLAFHKFLSRIQLSHNLAFPMTTWQLSLNLALDPCLDTPIKDTCIRSKHIILTEIYEIPCLLRLIFFRRLSSGDWCSHDAALCCLSKARHDVTQCLPPCLL